MSAFQRNHRAWIWHGRANLELCVAVWTVNEPADINAMIDLRFDAIVTDYPGRVHDANLIEAPLDAIDQHVERATHEMQKVSG